MAIRKKMINKIRTYRHDTQFRRRNVLQNPEAGQLINECIQSGEPLMVSRVSAYEMKVLNVYRQRVAHPAAKKVRALLDGIKVEYNDAVRFHAHNNAGIFPTTDEGLDAFSSITLNACSLIDILGVWRHTIQLEELLWRERCPSAALITLPSIEPYFSSSPWSASLQGKKVLVVHPFEKSICSQYQKRELLFPGTNILPEFELKTLKAIQSNAGSEAGYASWSDALDVMKKQIAAVDFDVALIGAGGYGLPLAAHVKELGKQAVHIGGALQFLFGIKGRRWDEQPEWSHFYNKHWIRPLSDETPIKFEQQSGGCYW